MGNKDSLELLVARVMSVTSVFLDPLVVWVRPVIRVSLVPEELMVMSACLERKVYLDWKVGREWLAIQAFQVARDSLVIQHLLDSLE